MGLLFYFFKRFKVDMHSLGPSSMVHGKNLNDTEKEYFGISNLRRKEISSSRESEGILLDHLLKSPFRTDSKATCEEDLHSVSSGRIANNTDSLHTLSDDSETTVDGKRNASSQQGFTDDRLKKMQVCEDIWFDLTVFLEDLKTSKQIDGNGSLIPGNFI